jgi:hypothetical protein
MHFCCADNKWILIVISERLFVIPSAPAGQIGPAKSDLALFGLNGAFLAHLGADHRHFAQASEAF